MFILFSTSSSKFRIIVIKFDRLCRRTEYNVTVKSAAELKMVDSEKSLKVLVLKNKNHADDVKELKIMVNTTPLYIISKAFL